MEVWGQTAEMKSNIWEKPPGNWCRFVSLCNRSASLFEWICVFVCFVCLFVCLLACLFVCSLVCVCVCFLSLETVAGLGCDVGLHDEGVFHGELLSGR